MIRRSFLLLAFLIGLGAPALAQSEVEAPQNPFLWKVEGEGLEQPSFMFGTIHLPDDRVLALSGVVEEALDACDNFYTEIPMDMATQMGAMQFMQLPAGESLKDHLPAELYARADAYIQSKGFQLAMFSRFKVWVVMTQMSTMDFMRDMMAGKQALDSALYARQQKAGKTVGGIETVEEQVAAFEVFTLEEQIKLFGFAMDGLEEAAEKGTNASEPLVQGYLSGDLGKLMENFEEEYEKYGEELTKKFNDSLLVERNHRMAERMAARMQEEGAKSHFFAVGTAHYPGETGLIKLLEERGFTVTRLTQEDAGKLMPETAGAGAR